MTMRKSVAAWQMLQRLSQTETGLIWNHGTGGFHFMQHCRVMDPVDRRSLDQLSTNGFVHRERSSIPVYTITDKGRSALAQREAPGVLDENAAEMLASAG